MAARDVDPAVGARVGAVDVGDHVRMQEGVVERRREGDALVGGAAVNPCPREHRGPVRGGRADDAVEGLLPAGLCRQVAPRAVEACV